MHGDFYHIADRFHLLMNITKMMMSEMKRSIPSRIILGNYEKINSKKAHTTTDKRTPTQIRKMQLIQQVQKDYKLTRNMSKTAKRFSLNFRTVKKYVSCKDPLVSSDRTRFSYLDPYKTKILAMYEAGNSTMKIYKKLRNQGIDCKYRTLNYFIHKNIKSHNQSFDCFEKENVVITRKQIFNFIFMYKSEPIVKNHIRNLVTQYPLIAILKKIYSPLRKIFLEQDYVSLKKILKRKMKTAVLNRIIRSLNTDYCAVLNAARYKLSNGVVEGSVSKLKRIKHSMYGKGSVVLLRNKAIYQSYFFRSN